MALKNMGKYLSGYDKESLSFQKKPQELFESHIIKAFQETFM